jgi:hypothetical protein
MVTWFVCMVGGALEEVLGVKLAGFEWQEPGDAEFLLLFELEGGGAGVEPRGATPGIDGARRAASDVMRRRL